MPVDRQLDAYASGDQPDLAAEIAHGIHVDLGVWVDPGDAPANAKTLGRHWSDRSQQPAQDEHRDDDWPPRERANGWHAHLLSGTNRCNFSSRSDVESRCKGNPPGQRLSEAGGRRDPRRVARLDERNGYERSSGDDDDHLGKLNLTRRVPRGVESLL